jgi:hypothetical protein
MAAPMTQSVSARGRHAPEHADGLKEGTRCRGPASAPPAAPRCQGFASSRRSTSIGGPCGRMIWLATRTLAASARLPVTLKLSPPDSSTANLRWRRPVSSKHGEKRGRRGRASSSCAPPPISPACAWRRASCVGARGAVAGLCINPSRSRSSRFDRRENAP